MNRLNENAHLIKTEKQIIPEGLNFILKNSFSEKLPDGYSKPYERIESSNFFLTNKTSDNCCYLNDKTIVVIKHICYFNNLPVILGFKYDNCTIVSIIIL